MKIQLLCCGKSKEKVYDQITSEYTKRLKHYCKFSVIHLPDHTKAKSKEEKTKKEAELILSKISQDQYVVLLDERGQMLSSKELADWIQHKQNISLSAITFVIAGAYGAHPLLKDRADYTLSLSPMTLTHDMVRIFIAEQIYRAHTILRGEKYHND